MAGSTAQADRNSQARRVERTTSSRAWRLAKEVVAHLFLIPVSIALIFPLVWLVSSSLKCHAELFTFPPRLIPDPVCWKNYPEALTIMPFALFFRNSIIYCVGIVTGQVLNVDGGNAVV